MFPRLAGKLQQRHAGQIAEHIQSRHVGLAVGVDARQQIEPTCRISFLKPGKIAGDRVHEVVAV